MLSRVTTMVYFDSLNGYVSFTYITNSCYVLEHSPCAPATATDQAPATATDQAPATATDQAPATATDQAPAYSKYTQRQFIELPVVNGR